MNEYRVHCDFTTLVYLNPNLFPTLSAFPPIEIKLTYFKHSLRALLMLFEYPPTNRATCRGLPTFEVTTDVLGACLLGDACT